MTRSTSLPLTRLQPYLRYVERAAWLLWLAFLVFSLLSPLAPERRIQVFVFAATTSLYLYLLFRQLFPRFFDRLWFQYLHLPASMFQILSAVWLLEVFRPLQDMVIGLVVVIGALMGGRRLGLYTALLGSLLIMLDETVFNPNSAAPMLFIMRLTIYSTLTLLVWTLMDSERRHWQEITAVAEQHALEMTQQSREMQVLHELVTTIGSSLDLSEVLRMALIQTITALQMDAGLVALLEDETQLIRVVEHHGLPAEVAETLRALPLRVGQGMAGLAVQEGKPLFSDDIAGDPRVQRKQLANAGYQSYICIPLKAGAQVFGVMTVVALAARSSTPRELTFVEAIGEQIGLAIQRARLFQQARRRLAQLSVLNQVGQAINTELELPQVLQTVYEQVVSLTGDRDFYIALYDEDRDEVDFVLYYEKGESRPRARRQHGNGPTEYVIRTRKPLLINSDLDRVTAAYHIQAIGLAARSWLGVPLLKGEKVIGVMAVQDYEREYAYDEEDLELFQTLAGQVAIAIDNARLYESTRRNLQEAEWLYQFSQQVARASDVQVIAQAALSVCRAALKADGVYVYVNEGDPSKLKPLVIWHRGEQFSGEAARRFVELALGERRLDGILGWVIRHGQTERVDDARNNPRYLGPPDIRSELCVPIMLQERVLGALKVESVELSAYTEQDERFVTTLAKQLAMTLESVHLKELERQHTFELEGLNQIAQAFAAMGNPQATYAEVTQRLSQIFRAQGALIMLYDAEHNQMRAQTPAYGLRDEMVRRFHYPLDARARALWDPQTQPAWIVNDLWTLPEVVQRVARSLSVRGFMGAAIYGRDGLIGLLYVAHRMDGNPFTPHDGKLLSLFARQTALVIENLRLVETERLSRQQLALLNQIGQRAAAMLALKGLLQELTEFICERLGYYTVAVFFVEGELLHMQAIAGKVSRTDCYQQSIHEGVLGWVARHGVARLVNDVREAPEFTDPLHIGNHSELIVPLISRGEVIGVLAASGKRPNQFSKSDLMLLSTIGDQVSQAIINARLYESERQRAKQMATISHLGREIASLLKLDDLLRRSVKLIREHFGYRIVYLFIADHAQGLARLVAGAGDEAQGVVESLTLRIGQEGLVGQAIGEQRAILENNVRRNPHYYEHPMLTGIHSELVMPIRSGERVLGALDVQDARLNAFTHDDLFILQTLADQLAVAMVNAELHMQAEHQAHTDSLTQVYNHGYFLQRLKEEMQLSQQRDQSLSLIMLDIDFFKQYNDRYGHVMGDRVLQLTVQAIRQNIKRDDLVGRWGGEEFGVALPNTKAPQALIVAQRIRQTLANLPLRDDDEQPIEKPTVSQGIATFPQHANSMEQLIDRADYMLYQAKAKGRDQIVLYDMEGL